MHLDFLLIQNIITKINDSSFKLSQVGVASDTEFYYRTKQYIDITSVGVGTHTFNYPSITATLTGKVGISSIGSETFGLQFNQSLEVQ